MELPDNKGKMYMLLFKHIIITKEKGTITKIKQVNNNRI